MKEELIKQLEKRLDEEFENLSEQWKNPVGTTTRSFVLDDVFSKKITKDAFIAFPKDGKGFFNRKTFRERKSTSANLDQYDQILTDITYAIQDPRIIKKISLITRLTNLEPDPSLYAGGLSMMFKGDFLNPHLDNSHDANRQKYRRLNVLFYVSPAWKYENGGNLELWDREKLNPVTIVSAFNRLAIMETNSYSWHSVSPVKVDEPRCCISNYYFSEFPPSENDYKFHVTSFMGRPGENLKRIIGVIDNKSRNLFSKIFRIGRGKELIKK